MGSSASTATPKQISVRVVADREKNRVLYAEAGKDFVDVLLSFLTLPLGTIARLVNKDSNTKPCRFGCISSLYASVRNLDPKYLNSETCKKMLLQTRNSMEPYNQQLKLNIDDTVPTKYYACAPCLLIGRGCLVSTSKNMKCKCGRDMKFVLKHGKSLLSCHFDGGSNKKVNDDTWKGYVKETASFIIFDDLNVTPADMNTTLSLLSNLRSKYALKEFTVVLNSNEILDLLKCLLISKTALTDCLSRKEYYNLVNSEMCFKVTDRQKIESTRAMNMNVLMSKSKSKILFAQVEDDFVDQLLSFLTFPLGAVERVLNGNSGLDCVDKLYNSLTNFDSTRDLKSEKTKNVLANLKVAPYYKVNNQMLPIHEVKCPSKLSYCYSRLNGSYYLTADPSLYRDPNKKRLTMCDPKSSRTDEISGNGFAKCGTKFIVYDDLSVKPFSSHQMVSSLSELKVPHHDLEEKTICVGVQEVVSILKASMVSTSALTIGLKHFFIKY